MSIYLRTDKQRRKEMTNLRNKRLLFDVSGEVEVQDAITEAIRTSLENNNIMVLFEYMGILIEVTSKSNPEVVYHNCMRKIHNMVET